VVNDAARAVVTVRDQMVEAAIACCARLRGGVRGARDGIGVGITGTDEQSDRTWSTLLSHRTVTEVTVDWSSLGSNQQFVFRSHGIIRDTDALC
jgi:hypothetical protein